MQSRMLKTICGRVCLAMLACCACLANAAPEDGAGGRPAMRQDAAGSGEQAGAQVAMATAVTPATAPAPAPGEAADALGFGPAADLGKLDRSRGGTDTHNETKLSGIVTNNSAVNVVTGNNVIDAGSFANMSGIPIVIQNSGANVLIQNSTVVNLQLK